MNKSTKIRENFVDKEAFGAPWSSVVHSTTRLEDDMDTLEERVGSMKEEL